MGLPAGANQQSWAKLASTTIWMVTASLQGPDNFGSLTAFLAVPQVAEKLEYTEIGTKLC